MSARRALMLVNRTARRGRRRVEGGVRALEAAGFQVTEVYAKDPANIPTTIRRQGARHDLIVIGGGDGTVARACTAVLDSGLPLGILPMGNANDLARTLGLPGGVVEACQVIAAGHTRTIDVGRVNGRPFFNAASLGVGPAVAARLTGAAATDRGSGLCGCVRTAWAALGAKGSFTARIACDDGPAETIEAIQLAVGNGRYYGGGLTVVDQAAIDDSRLDVAVILHVPFWRWRMLLPASLRGTRRLAAAVETWRGQRIHVETPLTMAISVDGEVVTETPADFVVQPAALRVFVP